MGTYKLSILAEYDLEDIYAYGAHNFGNLQAIKYLEEIQQIVLLLSENPEMGRIRNEIKQGLVSYPYKSHVIFYRKFKQHIRIVRILYGGRDLVNFLR